ncbi:MAG: dihydroorotate dehydrogenase [Oscillospiraceae bacterium]|jgi:dihydroorotate dehydrogenase (NAD+) catalytic subunit|nr:dihydroorotate dehydrogenase [Oscillospiraceae bacterium]
MDKLGVTLSGWDLENPIIAASGTFGYGYEFASWYDINILGSISLKGTTREPRFGNPTPRIAECCGGMLNAIGLQSPGVESVISEEIPKLRSVFKKKVIANVAGFSVAEYVQVAALFDAVEEVALLEINVSCPNVESDGRVFGSTPESVALVCREIKKVVKKPVYMKLSPNVANITEIAQAAESAGADGLVLINTLLGMAVDPATGKPIVSTKVAGFSGPAIKPIALRVIYQVYPNVRIPIIGVGGITCADDVIEFISVGATAVQVGSQNLRDPCVGRDIINELPQKMDEYGIETLGGIVGRSHR